MSSKIEWTGETWNPIVGCSIVSSGCTNCYAMKMAARLEAMGVPHYAGTTKPSKAGAVWTGVVRLAPDNILTKPLTWKKPRTVFVNSMSDLFHEDVPDEWIDRVFAVMALTPQHTYQVLTKRSARMREYMSDRDSPGRIGREMRSISTEPLTCYEDVSKDAPWPLPNVWIGVSAERQQEANARVPDLLATPAAVRFVSAEPLLGPVDFTRIDHDGDALNSLTDKSGMIPHFNPRLRTRLDWVIVGGESGPRARPMSLEWARSIRDQCVSSGVPYFFKQWGEWAPGENCGAAPTRTERTASWWANEWMFGAITARASREAHADDEPDLYRIGKATAGRLLDGREWNEMPGASKYDQSPTDPHHGRKVSA